jgi:predicted component of type VI protein secretion system
MQLKRLAEEVLRRVVDRTVLPAERVALAARVVRAAQVALAVVALTAEMRHQAWSSFMVP